MPQSKSPPDFPAALKRLAGMIDRASKAYEEGVHENDVRLARVSIEHMLAGFRNFLVEVASPSSLRPIPAPLLALASALEALDDGHVVPLLIPSRKNTGGNTRSPRIEDAIKAMSAVAMECGMNGGLSRHGAASQVAVLISGAGYRPRGRAVNASTVASWRDRAVGAPSGSELGDQYRNQRALIKDQLGDDASPTEWGNAFEQAKIALRDVTLSLRPIAVRAKKNSSQPPDSGRR